MHAHLTVNVDKAVAIGDMILTSMNGTTPAKYTFWRESTTTSPQWKVTDTLDSLCHKQFCEKVASKTSYVKPQSLTPTSEAAKYHSLRVYLEVQEWKESADGLHPADWG